ncbi:MAG: hypothetical protein AABY26_03355, partial [Nanoarchaeota archaeon]
ADLEEKVSHGIDIVMGVSYLAALFGGNAIVESTRHAYYHLKSVEHELIYHSGDFPIGGLGYYRRIVRNESI